MDPPFEAWFVALVSAVLGGLLLAAALRASPGFYQYPKVRWLARRLGPRAARWVVVLVALLLIGIAGWLIWENRS